MHWGAKELDIEDVFMAPSELRVLPASTARPPVRPRTYPTREAHVVPYVPYASTPHTRAHLAIGMTTETVFGLRDNIHIKQGTNGITE